jgi:hypothetical protein
MPDIRALRAKIPDEFKPIAVLGIDAFVLVCLVLLHGAGLHRILIQHKRGERRLRLRRPHLVATSLVFSGPVFFVLSLHIVEIAIWAFVLNEMGFIARAYDAIYFCANAYTTRGYGKVDHHQPMIGISRLFTFAWTTSALVDVVAGHSQLIEQLEDEREREMQLRSTCEKMNELP